MGTTTEKWVGLEGRVRIEIDSKNQAELQQKNKKKETITHTQTDGRIITYKNITYNKIHPYSN